MEDIWELIISIASLITSISVLIFYIVTVKNKYKFSVDHFDRVLHWHGEAVETIAKLKSGLSGNEKRDCLVRLSALIEQGRFYYPNIITGDKFGEEKPFAYQGYRNFVLDPLVFIYNICSHEKYMAYEKHIEKLQRTFTSIVFKQLNVRELNKNIQKNTVIIKEDIRMEDYLDKSPEELENTLLYLYLSPHANEDDEEL